jgi:hypothetical protein
VFENSIPENAPIRIKIKKEKEKSFKDVKDENWVRKGWTPSVSTMKRLLPTSQLETS